MITSCACPDRKLHGTAECHCAVCRVATGDRSRGARRRLAVDHDHSTGAVRGGVCVALSDGSRVVCNT